VNGREQRDRALEVIARLPAEATIPAQALGELFTVLVKKAGRSRAKARDAVLAWRDTFAIADTTSEVMVSAADIAVAHRMGFWDSVMLAASASAGARLLLSEGFHEGFSWGGTMIVNPMRARLHPALEAVLLQTSEMRR
jgi:predicted nucleic acid-binding protein